MTKRDITGFIREQLRTQSSQWNLGTFGAIAEFQRDPDEAFVLTDEPGRLAATTARGGVGFGDLSAVRLFASETAIGQNWSHRISLCLSADACAMNRRTVLTELGPDSEALRPQDRDGILFDMGLGTLQTDICIRTADPGLIGTLRGAAGRSLFESGNPAMSAIVAAGPHRVFMARFGRCEVYQPIPPADGKSPEGPHTHVLPKLLRSGRTHAATEPVPDGFVPCAHLVPAHPLKDGLGHRRPWDQQAHDAFQAMLGEYGDVRLLALKSRLAAAMASGAPADAAAIPDDRFARHAARVLLHQMLQSGHAPAASWTALLERVTGDGDEAAAAADDYGHG